MSGKKKRQLWWAWLSGAELDGEQRTNATWLHCSHGDRPVLHRTGNAWRWHHLPRLTRAGIRTGGTALAAAILYGWAVARALTIAALASVAAALLAAMAWHVTFRVRGWRRERHYVRPLERTLLARMRHAPEMIEVTIDDDTGAVKSVEMEWAATAEIGAQEKQVILEAVTTRLPIEAPDETWNLRGRNRSVMLTQSEPPPFPVSWGDALAAIQAAAANELVFGIGKRAAVSKASYGESPHVAIPGGSGGGKSNLAAFLLLQELLRGSLVFNLDPKWISHLWLQDLPNVISAHDTPALHLALSWLGKELLRRTKAAYYSAAGTGRVRGNVGPRIIVLCEELNYGMDGLKDYWREIRGKEDPKQSPAIGGLKAIATAGRASDMHAWLIAQLMTAASTGVSDSTIRTNCGITAMTRWDEPGWKMSVGKHVPMPTPTTIPGRIQLVTGDGPRETQVPYLHLDDKDTEVSDQAVAWARALAVSGTVAQIPVGPEGVPPQLWPPCVIGQQPLSISAGQEPETGTTVTAAADLTIAEAVDSGVFGERELGAARRRVNRARLEATGQRADGSLTYAREDLEAAALDRRRKELAR